MYELIEDLYFLKARPSRKDANWFLSAGNHKAIITSLRFGLPIILKMTGKILDDLKLSQDKMNERRAIQFPRHLPSLLTLGYFHLRTNPPNPLPPFPKKEFDLPLPSHQQPTNKDSPKYLKTLFWILANNKLLHPPHPRNLQLTLRTKIPR